MLFCVSQESDGTEKLAKVPNNRKPVRQKLYLRAMVDVELCNSAEQRNAEGAVECHKHTLPACILKGSLFSITLNTGLIFSGNVLNEDI